MCNPLDATQRVTVVGTHGRASVVSKVTESVVLTETDALSLDTRRASLQPLLVPPIPTLLPAPPTLQDPHERSDPDH